jgi:hypothetical protein
MTSWCVLLFMLSMATVSGQILDREGKPMAGAQITYQKIGTVDRNMRGGDGSRSESPTMVEGTGRTYKVQTDKKGTFVIVGVDYGVYQIDITAPDGSHVYSGKKTIVGNDEPSAQNILNVDLSNVEGAVVPGGGTNLAAGKKSKEQLELMRQENAHAAKINKLMVQYHTAVGTEDWLNAITLVKQLIVLDPNRWEFYQNLGTLQSNQLQYAEAAQSFAKGVEVAKNYWRIPRTLIAH